MAPNDPLDSDSSSAPPNGADASEVDVAKPDDEDALPDSPAADVPEEGEEKPEPLDLEVSIEQRSACERHIAITISQADIDRGFEKQFAELGKTADVPGFRRGHTPRKVIEAKFRKDAGDQVKSDLLLQGITQVSEEHDLSPISEPELNFDSVVLPDEGPLVFEFDIEVRPEFDLPEWKDLKIKRPVREFDEKDVDEALEAALSKHGQLVPRDDPAESGDYITTNLSFSRDGAILSSANEEVIRLRPVLSFRDGKIEKFEELMEGVVAGETRECHARLTEDAPNQELRGVTVTATFEVLEVKRLELPELTADFLEMVGDFESEADLRDFVLDTLRRRLEYSQHRHAREQVTAALTQAADWDLPPGLLARQSSRELDRMRMEMRRSGFGEEEIQAHENELRQNSQASTARALKEHFILERIAEEEEIDVVEGDYDDEIKLIARQTGETRRRVRARLEKNVGMDVLRNQIIERKTIETILEHATFEEEAYEPKQPETSAINWAAGGGEPLSDIPVAQPERSVPKESEPTSSESESETEQGSEQEG